MTFELALLAIAWLLYGALHSFLAADAVKQAVQRRFPALMPRYRLLYNGLATLLLLPLLFWGYRNADGATAFFGLYGQGAALLWAMGWIWPTLGAYDSRQFLGLGPVGEGNLVFSPAHRFVRHPWYCAFIPWLWLGPLDGAAVVSSAALTLYLWIGTVLEEQKLVRRFGDAYRDYQRHVPMLLPWPVRFLANAPSPP